MKPGVINLRSDTQTLPTAEMRKAMADAELGDDTYGEDPTVLRLEDKVAEMLGTDASLLVLSGTMANLVALLTHCSPGDEVFVDPTAHVVNSEAGGYAAVAGVTATTVDGDRGHPRPDAVRTAIHDADVHRPRPRLVWVENTNNRAGGTVMPLAQHDLLIDAAAEHDLVVHLDGARLFNAAVALDQPVRRLAQGADSVYIDLTKGLACPLGALLAGPEAFVAEARRRRRLIGGGMRQAGVIAACGLVALGQLVDRLSDDHEEARWLAERIADIDGYRIDPGGVDTNIVNVDVSAIGPSTAVAEECLRKGLLVSHRSPDQIRLVTHLQIDRPQAEQALRIVERVARARRRQVPSGPSLK